MALARADDIEKRMTEAGADAFNRGAPCVPGLDILWARELIGPDRGSKFAKRAATHWRLGWRIQAHRCERVAA